MLTNPRKILSLILITGFITLALPMQILASVEGRSNLNPRLVRLGDPFTIDLRIISDEEIRVMTPAFPSPGSVTLGNRGSSQQLMVNNGVATRTYQYTATYSTQEPGNYEIGPFRISYIDSEGETQELQLAAVTVEIYDDAPRPNSEIVPGVSRGWIKWLIIALSLALLAGLIFAWYRLRAKKPEAAPAAVVGRQVSIEETTLEEIKAIPLPDADDIDAVKEYYDKVDDILRKYITKRYDVPTHDCTLWEIKAEFNKRQRIDSRAKGIFEIINDCDWVKYAKTEPTLHDIRDVVPRCSDVLTGRI